MCGIVGAAGADSQAARHLINPIKHRGPDEGPYFIEAKNVSIGAVRLSIVDARGGTQPMTDKYSGNVLAQNGEIYNHLELRQELKHLGVEFESTCDTEVLLKGFTHFGPSFVEKLNGIFAIAFYDVKATTLYLFRDYFGIKPLYYKSDHDNLIFSSEIKSFFALSKEHSIDEEFVFFNYVFNCSNPEKTLYTEICAVTPGTYLAYHDKQIATQKYTPLAKNRTQIDEYQDAIINTQHQLTQSVLRQIPSEVSWGVVLSGGVDSSILGYIASSSNKGLKTYTICSQEIETDDLIKAREVAHTIKSAHKEIRISAQQAYDIYEDYLFTVEDINRRFVFYYLLSKAIKEEVKVALCGEGADELYAGYPIYQNTNDYLVEVVNKYTRLKQILGQRFESIEETINKIKDASFKNIYDFEIKTQLPYFQLNPVDKCGMRFGIEFRVPYLDLQHAFSVMSYPSSFLQDVVQEKLILRKAFEHAGLTTISRPKVFAGTRTLPRFYAQIRKRALSAGKKLSEKYPLFYSILDIEDLYALDIIDKRMRTVPVLS